MHTSSRDLKNIYEINTAVYLNRLSRIYGRPISLATVPEAEITRIASYGCDTVWLMGIWKRSPLAKDISLHDQSLMESIYAILPDFTADDMIGSAYAVQDYRVNASFGGESELAIFREKLSRAGLKLMLDFVPNHTALDNEWIRSHPEYYIQGTSEDITQRASHFYEVDGSMIALGKDPQFDPWPDVAQLNAFSYAYRDASIATLTAIASLCDAVRCDMAMLMFNDIFTDTWNIPAEYTPKAEYWDTVISTVRNNFPDFIFVAECYWNTEARLVEQGFDYCYDKTLYDRILARDSNGIQNHINGSGEFASHCVHFLENHDEARIATKLSIDRHREAIKLLQRQPSAKLWHDGQFEGRRVKIPVHIGRGPEESVDQAIAELYSQELRR